PVLAAPGSLIIWHGNLWHSALERTAPGLRLSILMYFAHPTVRPQETYRDSLPQTVLARHPNRFARLVGQDVLYGWQAEGPDPTRFTRWRDPAPAGA
ncbi:MAG TPA: hypothetical protein VFW13_07590, partial [Phenylobacterium sp.]|nr:hypothetical protein [Phenylobacterium sp.]